MTLVRGKAAQSGRLAIEVKCLEHNRKENGRLTEAWGDTVTVVIHHVPETEDYEGGFEAVAMTGVPHNVSVTGSDPDSADDALNHLLDGLRAFGFAGRVDVEDATYIGGVQRYEIEGPAR